MTGADPWQEPATAQAYRRFCARHPRYRIAARAIAAQVPRRAGLAVLDLGAGTGVSTRALLARLPPDARVTAVEPSPAMRDEAWVRDRRVRWCSTAPTAPVDVLACNAAWWLTEDVLDTLTDWRGRLTPGGLLLFSVPSVYVGLPDGSEDDRPGALDALAAAFIRPRARAPAAGRPLPTHTAIDAHLVGLGLTPRRHEASTRWTWATQRDWLSLPPVGLAMRPDLTLATLDDAVQRAVRASPSRRGHRTERWTIWAASA